jgi:uncharacterized membrane protein YjgN (DUF898 family)
VASGLGLLVVVLAVGLSTGITLKAVELAERLGGELSQGLATTAAGVLVAACIYLAFLVTWLYMQVRTANLANSSTSFPGLRIRSAVPVRGYLKLQTVNVLLTLLTLGLFRPFAAVRSYRYRLAHTGFEFDAGADHAGGRIVQGSRKAAGDGVADALGIDLSW